jgi:mannosyltransferase OCH1-like enzyme
MKKINFWVDDRRFLQYIQENNAFVLSQVSVDESRKIPKLMHFIWLGNNPFPVSAQFCVESFRQLHPDWNCKIWTDSDVVGLTQFQNRDIFQQSPNFGMKSDFLRYEVTFEVNSSFLVLILTILDTATIWRRVRRCRL